MADAEVLSCFSVGSVAQAISAMAAQRIEPLKTTEGVRTEMVSNIATARK